MKANLLLLLPSLGEADRRSVGLLKKANTNLKPSLAAILTLQLRQHAPGPRS
jgi:hypothetical protein